MKKPTLSPSGIANEALKILEREGVHYFGTASRSMRDDFQNLALDDIRAILRSLLDNLGGDPIKFLPIKAVWAVRAYDEILGKSVMVAFGDGVLTVSAWEIEKVTA